LLYIIFHACQSEWFSATIMLSSSTFDVIRTTMKMKFSILAHRVLDMRFDGSRADASGRRQRGGASGRGAAKRGARRAGPHAAGWSRQSIAWRLARSGPPVPLPLALATRPDLS